MKGVREGAVRVVEGEGERMREGEKRTGEVMNW